MSKVKEAKHKMRTALKAAVNDSGYYKCKRVWGIVEEENFAGDVTLRIEISVTKPKVKNIN